MPCAPGMSTNIPTTEGEKLITPWCQMVQLLQRKQKTILVVLQRTELSVGLRQIKSCVVWGQKGAEAVEHQWHLSDRRNEKEKYQHNVFNVYFSI